MRLGGGLLVRLQSDAFVAIDGYRPRNREDNPLYRVVAEHLETFLARQRERDRNVPGFVEREFREFLNCGTLAQGFIRVHCDTCGLAAYGGAL